MEFTEVIRARRSIREYRGDPVPKEKLEALSRALQAAPTGSNRQPFRFLFVTDPSLRKALVSRAMHQPSFGKAPLIVVPCCEKGRSFDTALALDHMVLAAADLGLGSCFVGWFERGEAAELLGIPKELEIPVLVPVGFAAESPEARPRKPLGELIARDRY